MVFNTISLVLVILAIPLWAYRQSVYLRLSLPERGVFKRIIRKRHEPAWSFGLKLYGVLVLAVSIFALFIYGLRYIKRGDVYSKDYSSVMSNRLYSGHSGFDESLDSMLYNQHFLIMILVTCLFLTISLMLFLMPFRDLLVMKRLKRILRDRANRTS
ncbi:hypothetical protein [Roseibium sp. RKSG952]|uniref:hypothetical protein n=1 Tax=Roseibium sp. RKSG952 TaxID=2529384 RepID=UPI0012BCD26A|nr:hypothetical protein [Roseibium sp. RKSG952]MTH99584.1 hypothetical protein [Roseibium sp. RKSG952]